MKFRAQTAVLSVGFSLTLIGCGQFPGSMVPNLQPGAPSDYAGRVKAMARPNGSDWSRSLVTSQDIQTARYSNSRASQKLMPKLEFGIPKLGNFDRHTLTFSTPAVEQLHSTSKMTGAPAFNYYTNTEYWLTEDGKIYCRDGSTGTITNFDIKDGNNTTYANANSGEVFPNTYITMSDNMQFAYVCSASNKLYVIDLSTGDNITGSPYQMSSASTAVGMCPPPWIDVNASDYINFNQDTVYCVSNTGTLYRFSVDNQASYWQLRMSQSYSLPTISDPDLTEYYETSPIVLFGKVCIGSSIKSASDPTVSDGYFYYYDTGITSTTLGSSGSGSLTKSAQVGKSVLQPSAIDVDNNLVPSFVFVPSGNLITFINLTGGSVGLATSVPLIVNGTSPTSGHPQSLTYGDGSHRILSPCAIDSWTHKVFAVDSNALWQMDYSSASYDSSSNPWNSASFTQRRTNFVNSAKTWFRLSHLGQSTGPVDGTTDYIQNPTAPLYDGTYVYTLDNSGSISNSTASSINKFTPGTTTTAPTLSDSWELTTNAATANQSSSVLGGSYMAQVGNSDIIFNTNSVSSSSAVFWAIQP